MLSHMIGRHMYSILRNPVGSHGFLRQSIGNARFDLNHLCQVQSELDRTAPARGLPKQFWGQPDLHSGVERSTASPGPLCSCSPTSSCEKLQLNTFDFHFQSAPGFRPGSISRPRVDYACRQGRLTVTGWRGLPTQSKGQQEGPMACSRTVGRATT